MTAGKGTYAFQIPTNFKDEWPTIHVTEFTADEAVDIGDINRDGKNDLVGTFGDTHEISWFENPGAFSGNWKMHHVAKLEHEKNYLDRIAASDLNGDKWPDIIVTEENQGGPASTVVYLNPARAKVKWMEKVLTRQFTTNSMSVADLDKDGDNDIITAEHRGPKRLTLWENDGNATFKAYVIDQGKESHDGAKLVDLDNDGDFDIVSIAWDKYWNIHVWWNETA